jgi:hypothetical protein
MQYPLEIHVSAPEGTSPELVTRAVADAMPEYANEWGDHVSYAWNLEAQCIAPIVYDAEDTYESPVRHIHIVVIPND